MQIRYEFNNKNFNLIPGAPIAYWVSQKFVKPFEVGSLLVDLIPVKKGMDTGDNDKYLRLWYETDYTKIDLFNHSKVYIPYDKGGDFRRWYGNNDYVLNWKNDGYELKHSKANLRSMHLYFKPSITWSALTSYLSSFRYSSFNGCFDSAGSSMFPEKTKTNYYLGYCNSVLANYFLDVINPTLNYGAGSVGMLPVINKIFDIDEIDKIVNQNISKSKKDWDSFETSWDFKKHPLI